MAIQLIITSFIVNQIFCQILDISRLFLMIWILIQTYKNLFFVSFAVGMVKQQAMEASEFQMSNEDFPALPGLSGPAPGQSAPAAPVPSSMDDLSGAPGALPNQLGGQPQGVIGSTISSSDMILQSTQQGKKILEFFTFI